MKYPILILVLLMAVPGMAADEDRTPYNFFIGANAYGGTNNFTVTFLGECYDGIASYGDWDLLGDNILDTINSWGTPKDFIHGPYKSTHEMNLSSTISTHYQERLEDTANHWLVLYAQHYMDSIEVSIESLYVHFDEDTVNITQQVGGTRGYDLTSLPYHQTRFSYQNWNNNSGDTFMYPGGYYWLHNGYNDDAKAAVAYAFKRYFIEDSANYESGKYMYTCYFADNQFRTGTMPRMSSYQTINYTFGGASGVMDWIEESQIENDAASLIHYYDSSTLAADSAIDAVLNAACDAAGLDDSIIRFANVDKYSNSYLSSQIKHTSVNFELIFGYSGDHWAKWRQMIRNQDTLQGRNDDEGAGRRYAVWECRLDGFVNEGSWNTSDRLYYGVYAWYLTFQESNMYLYPARFNDTTRWRSVYEVGLGDRIDETFDTTNGTGAGDYGTKRYVIQCKYINGADSGISLYRTGYSKEFCYFMADTCAGDSSDCPSGLGVNCDSINTNQLTDSISVALGGDYYQIDVDADTAITTVSSIYLHPCEGWIGIQGAPPAAELKGEVHPKGVYPKGVIGK